MNVSSTSDTKYRFKLLILSARRTGSIPILNLETYQRSYIDYLTFSPGKAWRFQHAHGLETLGLCWRQAKQAIVILDRNSRVGFFSYHLTACLPAAEQL